MGESPQLSPNGSFLHDLLGSSEHILFRIDLIRGGFDYISPIAESIYGVSLEVLHERGLAVQLEDLCDADDVEGFRRQIFDLFRKSPGQSIRTMLEYRLHNAA